MIHPGVSIFEQATELVSLDCSTIENISQSRNLQQQSNHQSHQSLRQSLLNLKTVLPSFTSQFNIFKQQIIDMSYYIVNKLMNAIKLKNTQISKLNQQLQKSLTLNNTMKNEVVQLKQMISEFMENYKKQTAQKDKLIKHKQQQIHNKTQQISIKINQINQLKNILKLNFNSPRNKCQHCQHKLNIGHQENIIFDAMENTKEDNGEIFAGFEQNQNREKNSEIRIEMSESILCHIGSSGEKLPLEVIQEEASDINSITDYLPSQRQSQKQNEKSSQILKSSRTKQEMQLQKQTFFINNMKSLNNNNKQKSLLNQLRQQSYSIGKNNNTNNNGNFSLIQRNPLNELKIYTNFQLINNNNYNTFSSRENYQQQVENKTTLSRNNERQRRCSEQIISSKITSYDDINEQKRMKQERVLVEKNCINEQNVTLRGKQQLSLKSQLQQISKSSSSSDIHHMGDTEKINVNLPKAFQAPKNMNFVKKNSSRNDIKEQRLKTQPTPRNNQQAISNKQNINLQSHQKPIQMGKKIFARKKMLMTHAKPVNSSRIADVSNKTVKQEIKHFINTKTDQTQAINSKYNHIEIKFIQSPEKQTRQFVATTMTKPSSASTIFSTEISESGNSRVNHHCADSNGIMGTNISSINESVVKSHHLYHSAGKYQVDTSSSRNSHKVTMTPGKPHNRTQQKRTTPKSKQKLKVTSKHSQQLNESSIYHHHHHHLQHSAFNNSTNTNNKKQRFLTEINQNQLIKNHQSITKLKNKSYTPLQKNEPINNNFTTNNSKSNNVRQYLLQIKTALKNYSLDKFIKNLRQVYFEGEIINGERENLGKLVYDNGMTFEGQFRQNKKNGNSKITLNGVDLFEGNFVNDSINGQGYLKFFRYFTNKCPKILQDASYFGRFNENNFEGMGTLFLNQKQKIVTKFQKGIPTGEVTFYSENDILFSSWPQI